MSVRLYIASNIPELEVFANEVIPKEKNTGFCIDLLEIEINVSEYLPVT